MHLQIPLYIVADADKIKSEERRARCYGQRRTMFAERQLHERTSTYYLLYTARREFCLLTTTGATMKQNHISCQAPRTLPDTLQWRKTNRNTRIARNAMSAWSCGTVTMAFKPQIQRASRKAKPLSHFKAFMPSLSSHYHCRVP